MLDRITAPEFMVPQHFKLTKPVSFTLSNGIPVQAIYAGDQDVVRIEWIFKIGNQNATKQGVALFTNKLITEGTKKRSAFEIQEKLADVGAFIEQSPGFDAHSITLYTLARFLPQTLEIVGEILREPTFAEEELEKNKRIVIQGYKVNLGKTSFLAGNLFREKLFSPNHLYGKLLSEEVVNNVERLDLLKFYQENYNASNCTIVVAGKQTEELQVLLESHFGLLPTGFPAKYDAGKMQSMPGCHLLDKADAVQSSVRYGCNLIGIQHEDYYKLYFLVEVLGGYFGSRLMQNIREDKGYTYGIHANVAVGKNIGYLYIATDVKAEHANDTIREIDFEIERLKTELVSAEELAVVKNYVLGGMLSGMATAFTKVEKLKTILAYGLRVDFYDEFYEAINTITPDDLFRIANKYFDKEQMVKVIVQPSAT